MSFYNLKNDVAAIPTGGSYGGPRLAQKCQTTQAPYRTETVPHIYSVERPRPVSSLDILET